jgi:hypothetical protein
LCQKALGAAEWILGTITLIITSMTRKPKPDDPNQFKRFIETAREIGANPDTETFDLVLGKVARSSRPRPTPKTRRPRKPKDRA